MKTNEEIKKATKADLVEIMEIINAAKERMKAAEIDQWQGGYPNEEVILGDIEGGNSYLFYEEDEPAAVFALFFGEDPIYNVIEEGEWLTDSPYSFIHRIAVANDKVGEGIMGRAIKRAGILSLEKGYGSIRIDTHPENRSMQRALTKSGFSYCGFIYLENGDLRLAYEKILEGNQ